MKPKRKLVYAYGFDKIGFPFLTDLPLGNDWQITFVGYEGAESLAEADGLVIPSGIFETFGKYHDHFGLSARKVSFDEPLLVERERQLMNAFKKGSWICFLLGAVDN